MEPAPGLAVLDHLLDGFRGPGCTSRWSPAAPAARRPHALPASVDLTAYRVIQESLTNVAEACGAVARRRWYGSAANQVALEVVVDDDGVFPSAERGRLPVARGPASGPGPRWTPSRPAPRHCPRPPCGATPAAATGLLACTNARARWAECAVRAPARWRLPGVVRLPLSAPPRTAGPLLAPPVDGAVG